MREGSTLETDMRTLDDIWQEQQILLPELEEHRGAIQDDFSSCVQDQEPATTCCL